MICLTMRRRKRVKKGAAFLVLVAALVSIIAPAANAAIAPSRFSTGIIYYSCTSTNMGGYGSMLDDAVALWNNGVGGYRRCCARNIELVDNPRQDVTVSFTSPYSDSQVYGRVSLWMLDPDGNGYNLSLGDGLTWEWAFLYVYPSHVSVAVQTLPEYGYSTADIDDCVLKTAVHEFGHILGLGHDRETVMVQGLSNMYEPSATNFSDLHTIWCS